MFAPLSLTVPIMPDEQPAQYVFRLAARNFMEVRPFSLDMGLQFERLVSGCASANERLAEVSGIPVDALTKNAFVKDGWKFFLRGQALDGNSLRRGRQVVCPECLKDDVNGSDLPPSVAMSSRVHWSLASIATCEKHNLALVTAAEALTQRERQNWSVAGLVPQIDALTDAAVSRKPSTLEIYLLDRLSGNPTESFLDKLQFYAVEQAVQLFGTFSLFGDGVSPRQLDEAQFHAAGAAGFEILNSGVPTISEFLERVQREFSRQKVTKRDRTLGAPTIYGRIYTRLSVMSKDSAFWPLTDVVADHVVSNFPVGPGDIVFNKPVQIRKLHSVLTVSKQFNVSEKRAVKVLMTGGVLPCPGCIDRDAIFDASKAEELIRAEVHGMIQAKAEDYLSAPKNLMEHLIEVGLIRRYRHSTSFHGYRFVKSELDEFLERLMLDAVPVDAEIEGALSISQASYKCRVKVSAIIQLILDRKLRWVGRRRDLSGLQSLLVLAEEVKKTHCFDHLTGLTVAAAVAKLRISPTVLRGLIKRGMLTATTAKHPITNRQTIRIALCELERFDAEFVTFVNFAQSSNADQRKLRAHLKANGIEPAPEMIGLETTFYRRSEISL